MEVIVHPGSETKFACVHSCYKTDFVTNKGLGVRGCRSRSHCLERSRLNSGKPKYTFINLVLETERRWRRSMGEGRASGSRWIKIRGEGRGGVETNADKLEKIR